MFLSPLLVVASLGVAQLTPAPKFELKDCDRIVWIGNTLVEREQRYGYWETALHLALPEKKFTLRNLGWSGDTVFGEARAGFDTPAKGFERLVSLTLELKPTVIFVSYGANESFDGDAGVAKFARGLEKLLDALKPANARMVLFSPIPVSPSETPAGFPDPKARNAIIRSYSWAIREIAKDRGHVYADLRASFVESLDGLAAQEKERPGMDKNPVRLTNNGVHLTEQGYAGTQILFLKSLGLEISPNALLLVTGDRLRQAIVEKNQLFFYKWRPQNETYLFGFRKHEQGKNAKEVAEFDPLVAKVEAEIETIRKGLK